MKRIVRILHNLYIIRSAFLYYYIICGEEKSIRRYHAAKLSLYEFLNLQIPEESSVVAKERKIALILVNEKIRNKKSRKRKIGEIFVKFFLDLLNFFPPKLDYR